ncbi:MAG: phosphatase PAP2 family protein [Bacteroidales bacterium]|nr:phosphatase PAP2 family protein [Bacteroidales bacterium]
MKGAVQIMMIMILLLCGASSLSASDGLTIYSTPSEQNVYSSQSISDFSKKLYTPTKFDKFSSTKFFEIAGLGVTLIVGGIAAKPEDNRFAAFNMTGERKTKNSFDDYIQYLPLATKYIMKVSGVKGRSSWGRMITSDILSVALMVGSVEALKHTIDMPRPNGEDNHSFPSGHTATAFMAATLLNKEYAHLSAWIPVASYAVAGVTAMGRQFNSEHWVSDLMVGAGIGIVSAELGYYFADLIFKDKGLLYKPSPPQWEYGRKPSRFTTLVGISTMLGDYKTTQGERVDVKVGNRVGFEGVYFPHKNIGVGGRITISNNMFAVDDDILEDWIGNLSLYAGAYYETQLSSRWAIGSKTLLGYNFYSGCASWQERGVEENRGSFGFMTGVSLVFLADENLRFALDCDYSLLSSSRVEPQKLQHELFTGISTSVMF